MGYISEDYCSEELSGMLMEKGYIGAINTYLGKDDINVKQITIQSAMKWLREVHNITIGIYFSLGLITYEIQKNREFITSIGSTRRYEQMIEEAIRYCLENLI